jgi:hypothetical protein
MPQNLIEALVAWSEGQDALIAAFPGGIHNDDAPTGTTTPLPYLTFTQGDSRQVNVIAGVGGKWVQWMTVNIESRAVYSADARTLGTLVRDALVDDPALMTWAGGRECGRYLTDGEGGELEDGMGPDGSDVWVHRIPITFTTARG